MPNPQNVVTFIYTAVVIHQATSPQTHVGCHSHTTWLYTVPLNSWTCLLPYLWCQQHSYGTDEYQNTEWLRKSFQFQSAKGCRSASGRPTICPWHDCTGCTKLQLLDLLFVTSAKCWDRPSYKVSYKCLGGVLGTCQCLIAKSVWPS